MNSLQPFESTTEQTIETMSPGHKTITAAGIKTNRITSIAHNAIPQHVLAVPSMEK